MAGLLNAFKELLLQPAALRCRRHRPMPGGYYLRSAIAARPADTHPQRTRQWTYITAGLIIVRNSGNGIQNVAIVMMQIVAPRRIGALLPLPRHTMAFMISPNSGSRSVMRDRFGASPAELLASQAIAPIQLR